MRRGRMNDKDDGGMKDWMDEEGERDVGWIWEGERMKDEGWMRE